MEVKAKELRNRTGTILKDVKKGEEVTITYRGESIAVIKPLGLKKKKDFFNPLGFGLWRNRKDFKDVEGWLRKKRKLRFQR